MFRALGILIAALISTTAARAEETGDFVSRELSRFSAGIVCTPPIVDVLPAPDTVAGYTNVSPAFPPFTTSGRQVPGVLGISFGVRSQAKAQDFPVVQIVVRHPPMGEDGVTEQQWTTWISMTGEGGSYFSLEFEYELVNGPWSIEAWAGDEVLYRVGFDVVDPHEVPELAALCGFEDLLS